MYNTPLTRIRLLVKSFSLFLQFSLIRCANEVVVVLMKWLMRTLRVRFSFCDHSEKVCRVML